MASSPPSTPSAPATPSSASRVSAGASLEEAALARASRKYDEEDLAAPSWALHKKHIFVISSAGKPIFSRYGDEGKLSALSGVLQALISFVHDSGGDAIRAVKAGRHRAVFLMRGPVYLVAVCCSGEPFEHLSRQLGFLHDQIISILTAKVDEIFAKNASYDLRGLLGGTDRLLRAAIHAGGTDPAMLLGAAPTLRMPPGTRAELGRALAAAAPPEMLFGVLIAHNHVVAQVRPKKTALHPNDLLLLLSTVGSSASFREDEAWLPICLPRFNAKGFLYAHVSFVEPRLVGGTSPELCLVMLTPKPDGFADLSAARAAFTSRLEAQSDVRLALALAVREPQYSVDDLGVPEVRHCLYRLSGSYGLDAQLSCPRTGQFAGPQCPYQDRRSAKRLLRGYMLAHARVHSPPSGKPLREYLQATASETILVWATPEAELYVAFGPLVSRGVAIAASHKLHRRLKKEQAALFLTPVTR